MRPRLKLIGLTTATLVLALTVSSLPFILIGNSL